MGIKKAQVRTEHYSSLCEIEYNHVFDFANMRIIFERAKRNTIIIREIATSLTLLYIAVIV